MEKRRTFPEVMLQISIAAIACLLVNIPLKAEAGIPVVLYILLFTYAVVSYCLTRLFLRTPKSLTAVVVFDLCLILAGMAAAFVPGQVTGIARGIFLGLFFVSSAVISFRETAKGISINMLILCFDILAALLMIYILFVELGSGSLSAAVPGFLGTIASFAGIIVYRDGSSISGRGRLYIILIIAAILAAAFLIYLLAGDTLREGFAGMFAGIKAALIWMGNILKEILMFLSRLFPKNDPEAAEADPGGSMIMPAGEGGADENMTAAPVLIFMGILVITAAVTAFIIFRKHRFSGKKIIVREAVNTNERSERISLWKALKIWAAEKMYRIRVKIFFLKNRNTPAGRYYRLVRSKKHTGQALRQGETPREFLVRYIESLKPEDRRIPELRTLIEELNAQLYRM